METRDRIRAAICNGGYRWQEADLAITLTPALREADSCVDLPLALAVLAVTGQLPTTGLAGVGCLGELGLDGSLRTPRRLGDRLAYAGRIRLRCLLAPPEAGLLAPASVRVWEAANLGAVVDQLTGGIRLLGEPEAPATPGVDLRMLPARYQPARRALEVAAAGGGHLAITTTMRYERELLAQLLASLLPDLAAPVIDQLTDIYPRAGLLPRRWPHRPPWQPVTHPVSLADLVGAPLRQPGLVSLAHGGVILIDQQPASGRGVADALCEVLEHRQITVAGFGRHATYPAALQLVLGLDHMPAPSLRRLLDHIDIHLALPPTPNASTGPLRPATGTTDEVKTSVARARAAATSRWAEHGWVTNSQADPAALDRHLPRLGHGPLLRRAIETGTLSVRGLTHVKRLAATIADLDARDTVTTADVAEAYWLRTGHDLL